MVRISTHNATVEMTCQRKISLQVLRREIFNLPMQFLINFEDYCATSAQIEDFLYVPAFRRNEQACESKCN